MDLCMCKKSMVKIGSSEILSFIANAPDGLTVTGTCESCNKTRKVFLTHKIFVRVFNELLNKVANNYELKFQAEEIGNPDTYTPLCACTPITASE